MTTVIVNDFTNNNRLVILLDPLKDFQKIDKYWEKEDKLLIELESGNPVFKNRKRWCDLSPTHVRILLVENLNLLAKLSEIEMTETHPTMESLTFLLSVFVKILEIRMEGTLELLRVNRIGDGEVLYDFSGSMNKDFDLLRPQAALRVVVDNT